MPKLIKEIKELRKITKHEGTKIRYANMIDALDYLLKPEGLDKLFDEIKYKKEIIGEE